MEIDEYGRIYGVGDNTYDDPMEADINFGCQVIGNMC